jgi:hypothetical protein
MCGSTPMRLLIARWWGSSAIQDGVISLAISWLHPYLSYTPFTWECSPASQRLLQVHAPVSTLRWPRHFRIPSTTELHLAYDPKTAEEHYGLWRVVCVRSISRRPAGIKGVSEIPWNAILASTSSLPANLRAGPDENPACSMTRAVT